MSKLSKREAGESLLALLFVLVVALKIHSALLPESFLSAGADFTIWGVFYNLVGEFCN